MTATVVALAEDATWPFAIRASIAIRNGAPHCVEMTLTAKDGMWITSKSLRSIELPAIVSGAMTQVLPPISPYKKPPTLRKRYRQPCDEQRLSEVARLYRDALARGVPLFSIAEALGVKEATARNLVYRARREGYLTERKYPKRTL